MNCGPCWGDASSSRMSVLPQRQHVCLQMSHRRQHRLRPGGLTLPDTRLRQTRSPPGASCSPRLAGPGTKTGHSARLEGWKAFSSPPGHRGL